MGLQAGDKRLIENQIALSANAVSQRYGSLTVLDDLNLSIKQHEFVALVGPSGCGKTTLLRLLGGHEKPASGTITRNGPCRTITQHGGLLPWLTVGENVELAVRQIQNPREREARVLEQLSLVGLSEFVNAYPYQLSGGMSQKAELARAMATDCDILLMDEPFSALDYLTRLKMRHELFEMLARAPRTVVLVTHDVEEAAQLADRALVLSSRPAHVSCELPLNGEVKERSATNPKVVENTKRLLQALGADYD